MEALPMIALGLGAGASVYNSIQSGNAEKQASQIASQQLQQEQGLLDQAKQQQQTEAQRAKDAVTQASQIASRRALAGNGMGFNSTILTPAAGFGSGGGGLITQGKSLLGG